MRVARLSPLVFLLVFLLAALCVESGSASAAQERQEPRKQELRELRIGIGLTKPPYILDGGLRGLEVEIVEQALAAGGYKMVPESYPPARALALMRAGKLDGMITVTEAIGPPGHFSDDYIAYQNVAITLKQRDIRLSSVHDLAGYSVAAFQNARYILTPEYALVTSMHPDYKEYPQQITQNHLLYAGRVDVVIGDRLVFRSLTRSVTAGLDTRQPVTVHQLFPPTPRRAVFREAAMRDAFNSGLRTIRQNGTYTAIQHKYRDYLAP